MEFKSIASSSRGNAYYIATKENALLLDCGVSMRRIEEALGSRVKNIRAVVLTHEHRDHIAGLGPFLRRYKVPVYASAHTLSSVAKKLSLNDAELVAWQSSKERIFGIDVSMAPLSHDAIEPLAYRFEHEGTALGFATDTGIATNAIAALLYNATGLIVEANHHPGMLAQGPYPSHLKARVASHKGHLSNEACAALLKEVVTERTSHILLAHLSEENNRPAAALSTVRDTLRTLPLRGKVLLGAAAAHTHGPDVELKA